MDSNTIALLNFIRLRNSLIIEATRVHPIDVAILRRHAADIEAAITDHLEKARHAVS